MEGRRILGKDVWERREDLRTGVIISRIPWRTEGWIGFCSRMDLGKSLLEFGNVRAGIAKGIRNLAASVSCCVHTSMIPRCPQSMDTIDTTVYHSDRNSSLITLGTSLVTLALSLITLIPPLMMLLASLITLVPSLGGSMQGIISRVPVPAGCISRSKNQARSGLIRNVVRFYQTA